VSPRHSSLQLVLNEELPQDIRERLDATAKEMDRTLNDTACAILVEHLGGRRPTSTASYRPVAARFKLMVPEGLHRKIRREAIRRQGTIRGVVLSILADHYGLEPIPVTRRPRRRSST
jgi:hypothetical protein